MREPSRDAAQMLAVARNGSNEALGEALEACRGYLLLVAHRELDPHLRVKGDASDLVQDTFFDAQRDFAQFQGESEAELLAWLRQVLLHKLANHARKYKYTDKRSVDREVALPDGNSSSGFCGGLAVDEPSPSATAMASERASALERALARLPEDYRRVIGWRLDERRSFDEIGQMLSRSGNAARKLWTRAIERLEQELERPP
jgi:RNA polymerase sigma-70 factor (ECF subfamily)